MDETLFIAIKASTYRKCEHVFYKIKAMMPKDKRNCRNYIIGYQMQWRPRCTIYGSSQYQICKQRCLANCPLLPITYFLVNVAAGPGEKMVQGHPIAHLALILHTACSANWVSCRNDCHSIYSICPPRPSVFLDEHPFHFHAVHSFGLSDVVMI